MVHVFTWSHFAENMRFNCKSLTRLTLKLNYEWIIVSQYDFRLVKKPCCWCKKLLTYLREFQIFEISQSTKRRDLYCHSADESQWFHRRRGLGAASQLSRPSIGFKSSVPSSVTNSAHLLVKSLSSISCSRFDTLLPAASECCLIYLSYSIQHSLSKLFAKSIVPAFIAFV